MSKLHDLTLVTLSYKRPAYLTRSLQYWSGRGPKIIALDGSPEPIERSALEGLACNVSYKHAPVSFMKRLEMTQSMLDTPYVALLADDDFYLPSAVEASIEFLEKNSDYSACICRPAGFGYESTVGVFGVSGVYDDMNNDYRVVSDAPGERMREHMGRYMPSTMYAVLRSKNWSKTIEACVKKEFPVFAMAELQMELSTAYLGKSAVLPILGWLKSTELEQTQGPDISLLRTNEFQDLWSLESCNSDFRSEFIETMADVLQKVDQRSHSDVARDIEATMDDYVAWLDKYYGKTIPFRGARDFLKRILPASVQDQLRTLRLTYTKRKRKSLNALVSQIMDSGTYVNTKELEEIILFVKRFHAHENID